MNNHNTGKSSMIVENISNKKNKKKRSEPAVISTTKKEKDKTYYKITTANALLIAEGSRLIEEMSDEEKAKLGSQSDTLHFMWLLGLASKPKKVIHKGREVKTMSTPIGVTLKTDIDIKVPYLKDVTKNNKTGINPIDDFDYKVVSAGEEFDLTLYEFMYLIIQDEYNGRLSVNRKNFYAYLSVKANAFGEVYKLNDNEGHDKDSEIKLDKRIDAKLPTPTIIFEKGHGSSRENMVDIDVLNEKEWGIRKKYERFKPLLPKRKKTKRNGIAKYNAQSPSYIKNNHLNYPNYTLWSLALQEELNLSDNFLSQKAQNEEELLNRGKDILLSMDATRRAKIGSNSGTLIVVNTLALVRFVGVREKFETVGFTLLSNLSIQVPIIAMDQNHETGINPETDISYRTVAAGEEFILSKFELMFLLLQDEYCGRCVCDIESKEIILSPLLVRYLKGEVKLPMPKFEYSARERQIIAINQIGEDGAMEIKSKYIRFAPLLNRNKE